MTSVEEVKKMDSKDVQTVPAPETFSALVATAMKQGGGGTYETMCGPRGALSVDD